MSNSVPPKITPAAARVNAGYTQKDAATKLGIGVFALRSYEEGKTVPPWDVVENMERLYKYPASYIFFSRNSLKASNKEAGA